ncbi:MAG: hypothetical protein ACREPX_12190 [Rhodanobacteraceae bacterium]
MFTQHTSPRRLGVAIAGLLAFAAPYAQAETGSAIGEDLSIHIDLLGIAELNVNPQAPVQIDHASTATEQENSALGVDTGNALLHLNTGVISSEAEYAPGVAISAVGARTSVVDLDLSAVGLLGDGILAITADLIQSRSTVMGYCLPARPQNRDMFDDIGFFNGFDEGNLHAGGPNGQPNPDDIKLEGLHISILGIEVPDLPLNPAPNTSIDLGALGIVGATLILNEQTLGGDGVNSASLTSNAVHVALDVAGLVTADVVLAHSDAGLDCTQ